MPKTLEEQLREEVEKRQRGKVPTPKGSPYKKARKIVVGCLSLGLLAVAIKTLYSPVNLEQMVPTLVSPKSDLQPVALPESGVLKQYRSLVPDRTGLFQFSTKASVANEQDLPSGCEPDRRAGTPQENGIVENENNPESGGAVPESRPAHYYVELLDWESNEVVVAAFVRNADKAILPVPYGTYKVRYTSGYEWYGETDLFGYQTLYEVTDILPKRTTKFEISDEIPQEGLIFQCNGGSLGKTRVDKDSGEKGIPIEPTDPIQSI